MHNLLSHTSGLGEYETGARTKIGGPFYIRMDYTEDELYKRINEMPMDFKPGEDWSYRNTNYVLLGILIHKVTGKFYGDFLQERIFRPLGMSRTRIISEADIIPRRSGDAGVGTGAERVWGTTSAVLAIVLWTCTVMGNSSANAPIFSLPNEFLAGASAACGIALVTSVGSLGGFVGSYAFGWIRQRTGDFHLGMAIAGTSLFLGALLMLLLPDTTQRKARVATESQS